MNRQLVCLVEGQGEQSAVPALVRRVAALLVPELALQTQAIRVPRNQLIQTGELERWVERTARKVGAEGALLVLIDSDDDCPAQLGPALLRRARAARPDLPSAVVLAHREYEAWFLAAAESLRGCRGLPDDLQPPPNPEDIGDAKGWLKSKTPHDPKYSPVRDQTALTATFDLALARNHSPSFDKCYREIERLPRLLQPAQPPAPGTP